MLARIHSQHTGDAGAELRTRRSVADDYVALVRIERGGRMLADWYLPRHAQQWLTAAEAQRDALSYAVRLTGSGIFAAPDREAAVMTAPETQSGNVGGRVAASAQRPESGSPARP